MKVDIENNIEFELDIPECDRCNRLEPDCVCDEECEDCNRLVEDCVCSRQINPWWLRPADIARAVVKAEEAERD